MMSEFVVQKTGHDSFDALHALGLAELLAVAVQGSVMVRDNGTTYLVTADLPKRTIDGVELLEAVLPLPKGRTFSNATERELSTLDGLLAVAFTIPGVRVLSVSDIETKARTQEDVADHAIKKAADLKTRLIRLAARRQKGSRTILDEILEGYGKGSDRNVQIGRSGKTTLTLLLTLDPVFAYGARRPFSDGLITNKINVAMSLPRLTSLIAYVGAAGFLRGQRTSNSLANLYTPIPGQVTISPDTSMRRIEATTTSADDAALVFWLEQWKYEQSAWNSVAVQTLQLQSGKAPFSAQRMRLTNEPLNRMERCASLDLSERWSRLLSQGPKSSRLDQGLLRAYLMNFSNASLFEHLLDLAQREKFEDGSRSGIYTYGEVCVMANTNLDNQNSLASILNNERGTLRFGRSLRHLAEFRPAVVHDILEELEGIRSGEHLIRTLAKSVQMSALLKAESDFLIIPDEIDLSHLYADINRVGAREIASMLLILSSLRYPARSSSTNSDQTSEDADQQAADQGTGELDL